MGSVVSSGQNNDDLIDNLLEADYIKTSIIERVFRAVDRAEYFLPEARGNAYKDLAWKSGNLHLSAPCIYSEVMEGLCLEPGLSFLNLGSGTGYLSTMVGLILGSHGINHGIEYHNDVVQYANRKLDDFRKFSGAIDEFDYCQPKFIQGNCLCLTSDCHAQYDRVYCGAACPEQYESYMKNLLKVGGILVMPLNDQLLQIKRNSETNWDVRTLLPVSFASLIEPPEGVQDWVQLIEVEPTSLQSLCRAIVRNILRKNIEVEHPPVKRAPPVNKAPKKKRALRRLVVPLFESDDSSDDDRHVRIGGMRNRDAGRATFREENVGGQLLGNLIWGTFREGRHLFSGAPPISPENNLCENIETEPSSEDNRMETDTTESTEESDKKTNKTDFQVETHAVIEYIPSTSQGNGGQNENTTNKVSHSPSNKNDSNTIQNQEDEGSVDSINEIHNVFVDVLNVLRREREEESVNEENDSIDGDHGEVDQQRPGSSEVSESKKKKKREKFDSGLGDEIVENHSDSSDDENDMNENHMKLDIITSSDNDEDQTEKRNKRGPKTGSQTHNGLKWRRIDPSIRNFITDSSSEAEVEEEIKIDNEIKMYESPYTEHMKARIQDLPLPPILKRYLNFYREF